MPLKVSPDESPTLNLTSMIDVLFLLIIFFMASTQFSEMERNVALQIPTVGEGKNLPAASKRQVINIHRDGRIQLASDSVTLSQLSQRLKELRTVNPRLSVLVRGDGEGTFQNVASVLAACREAGISELGISVRLARAGEPISTR